MQDLTAPDCAGDRARGPLLGRCTRPWAQGAAACYDGAVRSMQGSFEVRMILSEKFATFRDHATGRGGGLSLASTISKPVARESRQTGRGYGARVFRAAARHSRFVRFLRMAIPAGILAVAGVIIVATFFNPFRLIANFPIDPGKVSLSGTRIVMEAPRLNGFTSDGRPYELTARAAVQDITKPDVLELSGPVAHVDLKDGAHVDIQSINGLYDTKSELLKLSDHVVMVSSSGYEAYLSEATVGVRSGQIVSESPVSVKLPNGWLNSKRLEVVDNGALLRFGGGVDLTLEPESQAPPATTPAPAAPAKTPTAAVPAKKAAAAAAARNPAATAPASAVSPSQRPVAP